MKDNKKISIIVPIYNIEKYLEECINSIINQTYANLEIILVDDGSTDKSGQLCDYYAKKDNRIIVIHKKNGGLVSARKAGLDIAIGDYIAFVDGDDWVENNMYESLLEFATDTNADFVESGYYDENEKTGICTERLLVDLIDEVTLDNTEKWIGKWLKDQVECPIRSTIWSKLYKAELIKKSYSLVPDDMSRGEDFVNFINLLFFARNKVYITAKAFYHYRSRENSLSHDKSFAYYIINQDLYAYVKRLINDKFPKLKKDVEEWRLIAAKNGFKGVIYNNKINTEKMAYNINNVKNLFNKKIILYGAGAVGRDYYSQIIKYEQCQLVAWVDKNYSKYDYQYYNVKPVNYILKVDYDIIVIAVLRFELAVAIKKELLDIGIPEEKITWIEPYDVRNELK